MFGAKASGGSYSFIRKHFIFQHSADCCFSAAAKGGSGVPRHSPRAGRFPFPGPSKPNGISSRSLHRICHRLAAASSRFAKAAKQAWKHTLSHRRCLLCAHGNGASRVKREGHHLHLRRELPQPRSPAEIPPPPSLQTGRASSSSPKMLRVYPLKENLPKPCLPPQSTVCAGCWQREAWQLRLLSSASPGRPATAALSSGAIWRVRSSGTGEEGETCVFKWGVFGSVCDRCSHTNLKTPSVRRLLCSNGQSRNPAVRPNSPYLEFDGGAYRGDVSALLKAQGLS